MSWNTELWVINQEHLRRGDEDVDLCQGVRPTRLRLVL